MNRRRFLSIPLVVIAPALPAGSAVEPMYAGMDLSGRDEMTTFSVLDGQIGNIMRYHLAGQCGDKCPGHRIAEDVGATDPKSP